MGLARGHIDMPWRLNRAQMADSADDQVSSAFFQCLPPEVRRMIYVEFWRLSGLKQHIMKQVSITPRYRDWRYSSSPCAVEDQNGPDERFERFKASIVRHRTGEDVDRRRDWIRRIDCVWSLHWECEEIHATQMGMTKPSWKPFLPVLLTCKLMYLEAIESISSDLTFVFVDIDTAKSFITSYPPSTLRSIELCVRSHPVLTELYYPEVSRPGPLTSIQGYPSNGHFLTTDNPWTRLCAALASCTALRSLNIAFDIRDLRAWADRVYEKPFFEPLWHVQTTGPFVLRIPTIQKEVDTDEDEDEARTRMRPKPAGEGIEDAYLDGENLLGAPFVVLRAPRPDYMRVHRESVGMHRLERLTLPAP